MQLLDSSTRPRERELISTSPWFPPVSSSTANWVPSCCLNGTVPPYLAGGKQRVTNISGRSRLRSASTALLQVPQSKYSWWLGIPRCCRRDVEQSTTVDNVFTVCFSSKERGRRNCSDDRMVAHVTERHGMYITANVTAAVQSSWKMIGFALKFVYDDDDDIARATHTF